VELRRVFMRVSLNSFNRDENTKKIMPVGKFTSV